MEARTRLEIWSERPPLLHSSPRPTSWEIFHYYIYSSSLQKLFPLISNLFSYHIGIRLKNIFFWLNLDQVNKPTFGIDWNGGGDGIIDADGNGCLFSTVVFNKKALNWKIRNPYRSY